ncbi:MAG: hypothetical protein IJW21_08265 [Clostridia bacterium]|nr:hypothetical protein [Clostridia bacterium]
MKKIHFRASRAGRICTAALSLALAVMMLASCGDMFLLNSQSPINFLMKQDLSKYVDVDIPETINYADVRDKLVAGYDLFRVGLTDTYFGTSAYVEEGATMDFTLAAELVTKTDEGNKYTAIEMPEQYAKMEGYRPYSKEENYFFDKALATAGSTDDAGFHYLVRDTASKFTLTMPEDSKYGEYAGAKIRFTVTVTDYVCRYIYLYGGSDNTLATVGDWYCKIAMGITTSDSEARIKEGDVIVYDCVDTLANGTKNEYKDNFLEVTSDYLDFFEGHKAGDEYSKSVQNIKETFTIKAVYPKENIEASAKNMGYVSTFYLKEEIRMWCYAVYSDGFMAIFTKQTELKSYPKKLINTYTKLEDQTWETEFRASALSMAESFGDDFALEAYKVEGFSTVQEYLDSLVADHVKTLVRELVISYRLAKEMDVLDDLHKRYETTIENYIETNEYSTKREALESLAANGDEACIFYSNFLSPVLGVKFAERVQGLNFGEFIKDSYVSY